MLIPMALADRKRALLLAAWCTFTSVVGGMVGYVIGAFLYDSVGHWVVSVYGGGSKLEEFRAAFAANAVWIILGKGLTPIPFKLVTIAAGFAKYDFGMFVMLSIITRAGRFFLVAGLIYFFGDRISNFLEKWLEWVMLGFAIVVVAGFILARYVF
jgi:membrane protein YqaA with SNARE-associated domain